MRISELYGKMKHQISNEALQNLADLRLSKMVSYLSKIRLELASTKADDVLQADLLTQEALNIEFMLKDLLEQRRAKIMKAALSNRKPAGDMTLAEEGFYKDIQRALVEYIVVRFLRPIKEPFMGLDEMTHGPFEKEDVAKIPAASLVDE